MNIKSWIVLAILSFVLGLTACQQQGADEGAQEPTSPPTQEPGRQQ